MRGLFAGFALLLLLGCPALTNQGKENFSGELLTVENLDSDGGPYEELNDSGIDALFQNMTVEKESITVVYFYEPGCTACITLGPWVDQEIKKYNQTVVWHEYDTTTKEGWAEYLLFAKACNVSTADMYVPAAYVGGKYYWGIDGIRNQMGAQIDWCHENGCYNPYDMLD